MKTRIILTIFTILVYLGVHFYVVPTELAQTAVDQLKDTPNSTANVRVVSTIFDNTLWVLLLTNAIIWWEPVTSFNRK